MEISVAITYQHRRWAGRVAVGALILAAVLITLVVLGRVFQVDL